VRGRWNEDRLDQAVMAVRLRATRPCVLAGDSLDQ
jgi:hypothetical protein